MCRHAIPLLRLSTGGDLVAALRRHFAAGDAPSAGRATQPGPHDDDRLAA
jgi:hypothetical protein